MLLRISNNQLVDGQIPEGLLHEGITNLDLAGCGSLTELPENLPAGLTSLNLTTCRSLTHLLALPAGLTNLGLGDCRSLRRLPALPVGLTNLDLNDCRSLRRLPALPVGLTHLNLGGCKSLAQLPNLPVGLTYLNLGGYEALEQLPALPDGITKLYIDDCNSLTQLTNLPAGLIDLDLILCESLEQLPALPVGLTQLVLGGCKSLAQLPNLPVGLTYLNLGGCEALAQLPNLPAGITSLDLSGCISIQPTPHLLRQLEEIERLHVDAQVIRPQHWPSKETWIDEAKKRLYTAIKNSGLEPRPSAIIGLFHRFTSEGLYARSLSEIMNAVAPVIDLIETDPSYHLKWIEETALSKIGGCVNQPVQNWLEISGFTAMYQENLLLSKIEASKQIFAREELITFINYILPPNKKPGQAVEVEFANALMREVHKILEDKKVIDKPWLGIPGKIAYEGTVERYLTQETITEAYDYIMEKVILKNPKELTKLALEKEGDPKKPMKPYEHLSSSWIKAVIKGNKTLEATSRAIDLKYEEEKASLMERIGEEESPEEQERLGALYNSIDSRKEQEKVEAIMTEVEKPRRKLPPAPPRQVGRQRRPWQPPSTSAAGVVRDAVEHVASGRSSPQAGEGPPLDRG